LTSAARPGEQRRMRSVGDEAALMAVGEGRERRVTDRRGSLKGLGAGLGRRGG